MVRNDPKASGQFKRLQSFERRLAAEYAKPILDRDSLGIANWEGKIDSLQKNLARTFAEFGTKRQILEWQQLQTFLKKGEAALEFVRYNNNELVTNARGGMYAALLLLPDQTQPLFIPLCRENQLQKLIKSTYDKALYVNNVYNNNLLFQSIWNPIEKELTGIKTIYFSPSGLLHRLNLNAIKIIKKNTLGDKYHLVQLNSTRQLVKGSGRQTASPELTSGVEDRRQDALLFGGIQYDMDTTAISSVNYGYDKTATRGSLNFSHSDSTHRGGSWDYLDWTEIETAAIESILKENNFSTTLKDGYKATEEAFKSIASPSPRILHIATHGFFFPDPEETADGGRQTTSPEFTSGLDGEPVFKISDHPMIRSGLIMAGGNHAWETGKPFKPNMEDGVLTAYEISQMDLSNTELVVLSACETGLGDIEGNEGVYGLQRAFKIAGAKYLIMSLWQVPDYQTQQLMITFYKKWLTEKMSIPDAFHSAQQEMRKLYRDPFFGRGLCWWNN